MKRLITILLLCSLPLAAWGFGSGEQNVVGSQDQPPLGSEQDAAGATFTTIPVSATANTKGAYTQLIASTTNQTLSIQVLALAIANSTDAPNYLVDIARSSTVTISIASPGVITWTGNGIPTTGPISFTTSSALPTGLVAATTYYVHTIVDANTFTVSATPGGVDINTTGSQSGTQTGYYAFLPNLDLGAPAQYQLGAINILLPVNIPASTQILARAQTNLSSSTETVGLKLSLYAGGFGAKAIDALNASTTTSFGTVVAPGNGSKGAYVQMIASTLTAYKGFYFTLDAQGAASSDYNPCAIDIASGASGSEVPFIVNSLFQDQSGAYFVENSPYMPFNVAAGTRISARIQCSNAQNHIGVSVYGVY